MNHEYQNYQTNESLQSRPARENFRTRFTLILFEQDSLFSSRNIGAMEMIYGQHAVRAVLENRPEAATELWLLSGRDHTALQAIATAAGIPIQRVSADALRKHTEDGAHQGVAVRVRSRTSLGERDLVTLMKASAEHCRFLVLDGITDPHNLGSCLRVSEASGITAVITPTRRQASLSASVYKSASGSAERIPLVQTANLARTLESLKKAGVWLYAACGDHGTSLWETSFQAPWAIVLGSEGSGMRARTRALCDFTVRIPMQGKIESLNIATAAGVLLFEAGRQHASQP